MSVLSAHDWIERLHLSPHPEGGYYRETYRAKESINPQSLPKCFRGARQFSTCIYYLLEGEQISRFHRIHSDELWHFYAGGPLVVHVLPQEGASQEILLGSDPDQGESFQGVVLAGDWFGASLKNPNSFALVGCAVSPGFDARSRGFDGVRH